MDELMHRTFMGEESSAGSYDTFKSFCHHIYVLPLSRWLLCTYYTSAVFYVLLSGEEGVVFYTLLLMQVISLIKRLKSRLLLPLWTVSELDRDILSDNS